MPLGTVVSLGPGDVMLDGSPLPHIKGHSSPPHFSLHVYIVAKRLNGSGWYEVGLGPDDIVLDGTQLSTERGTAGPHFSANVYCVQTVGHLNNC